MDPLRTWRLLLAHRWMLLVLVLCALAASVGVSYLVPPGYESTTLILVQPHERLRVDQNRPEKEILNYPVSQLAPIDVPSRTYIEVIKTATLAEQVVRALGLDKKRPQPAETGLRALWGRAKQWVGDSARDTWMILKYGMLKETDPVTAAIERVQDNISLRAIKDTYLFEITFLSRDPEVAAAVANKSAAIFVDYMTATDLSEARANRIFLENRLQATEGAVAEARRALQEFKGQQATFSLKEEYSNELRTIAGLEQDLEKTDARLEGLLKSYTAAHPKVESLLAERDRLQQSLVRLRSARSAMPEKEKQLEDLVLHLKMVEEDYSVVSKALTAARIREAGQVNDIRVVSPAVPATYPAKPIKVFYAAAGAAAALLLGVVAVLLQESMRARVRGVADAQRLGLRVLATIPSFQLRQNA